MTPLRSSRTIRALLLLLPAVAAAAGAPGAQEPSTQALPPGSPRILTLAEEDTLDLTGIAEIGTVDVRARRLSIGEIVQRCIEREEDLAARIQTHRYTQLTKSVFHVGGYGPAAKKLMVTEQIDRVSYRRPRVERQTPLIVERYVLEKGERKPWEKDEKEGGGASVDVRTESLERLPFYLEDRDAYEFRILERSYVEGRLIYQVFLRPRSDFEVAPEGTIWVDTSNFQILREEFHFGERVPMPIVVRSLGPFVRERERIGDLWVWKRWLVRVDLRTGLLRKIEKDFPETIELVIRFEDHEVNADSLPAPAAVESAPAPPASAPAASAPSLAPTGPAPDAKRPGIGVTTAAEDPLDRYLQELARTADGSYSGASRALSIRPGVVDSLVHAFDLTGEAPDLTPRPRWDLDVGPGALRYNRVEGLNLMPRVELAAPTVPRASLFGSVGYGTASEEATWRAGARLTFGPGDGAAALEVSHRRDVVSYGSGRRAGNSWTALFLGKDDADYLQAEGWTAGLRMAPGRVEIGLFVEAERQGSLDRATRFHLLGGEAFRPNPAIDDGRIRAVRASARVPARRSPRLSAHIEGCVAGGALGGDFSFDSFRASLGARKNLAWGDELSVELSGGRASGAVPFQGLFHLGGFATLRGYDVNEFPIREFVHLRFDNALGLDLLDRIPWIGKVDAQLVPFFDAAALLEGQARDGRAFAYAPAAWRFAAGLGIQKNLLGLPGPAGRLRLDIARRLDRGEEATTARILFTIEP